MTKPEAAPSADSGEPHYLGHRERLRDRFRKGGADALGEYELLELILFRAMPRRDVKPLAKSLIARFGSFAEAVSARLPVIGVAPAAHRFTDEEEAYREFLIRNGWCRVLPIAALTPESFALALAEIEPLKENPLDALAALLKQRLPALFSAIESGAAIG